MALRARSFWLPCPSRYAPPPGAGRPFGEATLRRIGLGGAFWLFPLWLSRFSHTLRGSGGGGYAPLKWLGVVSCGVLAPYGRARRATQSSEVNPRSLATLARSGSLATLARTAGAGKATVGHLGLKRAPLVAPLPTLRFGRLRSFPLHPRRAPWGIEPLQGAARANDTRLRGLNPRAPLFAKPAKQKRGLLLAVGARFARVLFFRGAPRAARPPGPLPPPALTRRRSSCVPSRGVGFGRSGARARAVSAGASLRSAAAKVASSRVPSLSSPKRASVARFARSLRPLKAVFASLMKCPPPSVSARRSAPR